MRRIRFGVALATFVAAAALTQSASAVRLPTELEGRPAIEVAIGAPLRVTRDVVWDRTPRAAHASYAAFLAEVGGPGASAWRASWDSATDVPSRLYGPGLAAPGTIKDALAAEAFARGFLNRHLSLLAPGATPADFELSANDLDTSMAIPMRTVAFVQRHLGMPVRGGQVSFRFKQDRLFLIGSEALPRVEAPIPDALASDAHAMSEARAYLLTADALGVVATSATPVAIGAPLVLPLVRPRGVTYAVVREVTVETTGPIGRWSVFVDAQTGAPVARQQRLMFASGWVGLDAPVRYPAMGRFDFPARFLDVVSAEAALTTDGDGVFALPDGAGDVAVTLVGPYVNVFNDMGAKATATLPLTGGEAVWTAASDETVDAQIATFVHADVVKQRARAIAPQMPFLDQQLKATVNINDVCNAYSDGNTINFFQSGSGCENTGRIADVVYHEFGHAFHYHAIIAGAGEFEGALSEGISDYLAATTTGDPGTARGFFKSNEPLRHIDPPNGEHVWPVDVAGEVHYDGLIIAGALWDLRKALVDKYGDVEGVALADQFFYQGIRRAVDMPSMYLEILAADDDDGDLDNGTPNVCEINETFGAHGLRAIAAEPSRLGVVPPDQDGYEVSLRVRGLFAQCAADNVEDVQLRWQERGAVTNQGQVTMVPDATSDGGPIAGDAFVGVIPSQRGGTVIQYAVELGLEGAPALSYPDNAADPRYEMFVGKVVELYCTDFETDPALDGWTHALESGSGSEGADDWQWGRPGGAVAVGDPLDAYSGEKVFGNDLALKGNYNGAYQSDKTNSASTPVIDVAGYDNVRLQYRRWLNVEDGFYDQASIYSNGTKVWQNLDSGQGNQSQTHHTDREWRFHDVDLSDTVVDGTVQVKFEIKSDGGYELGGWTLDDVCVVAYVGAPDGAGCEGSDCGVTPRLPGGADDSLPGDDDSLTAGGGCGCRAVGGDDRGTGTPLALGLAALGLVIARRRRARG